MDRFLLLLLGLLFADPSSVNQLGAAVSSTNPASAVNRTWQWQMTITPENKITVAQPERYTILLDSEGKLQAKFDCNSGGGDYRISKGRISFGPLISTRMACPPDTQEALFIRDLQRVHSFFVEKGSLYLEVPLEGRIMQFRSASAFEGDN